MNVSPFRSLTAQVGRLSIGISRTSIRLGSSKKKQRQPTPPNFEPGHGEKIWIFNNFLNGMTVYSHEPVLKANRALKQIPFNGKKLKPAKIRKDFWRRMAVIQFPEGFGHVGRSVYHIMREFRMVHELSWGDDMFFHEESGRTLTRHERGERLNDQKANSIADIAAVLGGAGKGNKMWVAASESADVEMDGPTQVDEETGEVSGLLRTTIFWETELDKNFATKWPANVSHSSFKDSAAVPVEEVDVTSEAGTAELVAEDQISQREAEYLRKS